MTREQFNNSFTSKSFGSTVLHCDDKEVQEGIDTLLTYTNDATSIINNVNKCISDFKGLTGYYGVVQSGCLSEDNVLFDLDIPSWGKDENTEKILEDFPIWTNEVHDMVQNIRTDIINTKDAITMYANADKYTLEELKAAASKISLFEDYDRIAAENPELGATIPQRNKTAEEIANGTFQKNKGSGLTSGANGVAKRAVTTTSAAKAVSAGVVSTQSFKAPQATEYKKPEEVQQEYLNSREEQKLAEKSDDTFNKTADGKVSTGDTNIKVEEINKDDLLKNNTKTPTNTTTSTATSGTVHGGGGFSSTGYSFNGAKTTATATTADKQKVDSIKLGGVKGIAASGQGNLASSITSTQARSLGTISKIEKPINQNSSSSDTEDQQYVLPTAAALSAASVAGIGTNVYVKQTKAKEEPKEEENRTEDKTNQRVVLEEVVNKTQQKDEIRKQMEVEEKHPSMDGFIIEENEL